MQHDPVVIVGAKRTPIGGFLGLHAKRSAPALGGAAIAAALADAGVPAGEVSELIMGCVLPAGLGQAPARQAGFAGGLSDDVPATTVNKVCGSGMKAIMLAHDQLLADDRAIIVAGGMESMSNAPYLLDRMRSGARLGHATARDHLFVDGIEDAYDRGVSMGKFADETAAEFQIGRAEQDDYAIRTVERAQAAQASGVLRREIAAIDADADDEGPGRARIDKIPALKPAFGADGTVTAASSASISDGAAALVLMRRSRADHLGLSPLATIRAQASFAQRPARFTTAPIGAIRRVLDRAGWQVGETDLFEVNEAFALVPMLAMRELGINDDRMNVHGGACVLGHPLGASGARIVVTLLAALAERGARRGVASLCIGGGEATAIAIERIEGDAA